MLAKRKLWIVEAVPKDKYYLYGKIELYIDKEGFVGAWNRKFSWNGELLADFVAISGPTLESTAADGAKEWLPSLGVTYFAGLNLKMDRATVSGFPLQNRDKTSNQSRVPLDPEAFGYQALQNRGKESVELLRKPGIVAGEAQGTRRNAPKRFQCLALVFRCGLFLGVSGEQLGSGLFALGRRIVTMGDAPIGVRSAAARLIPERALRLLGRHGNDQIPPEQRQSGSIVAIHMFPLPYFPAAKARVQLQLHENSKVLSQRTRRTSRQAVAALMAACLLEGIVRAGALEQIAKDCEADWPDNARMQEYCVHGQHEAVLDLVPLIERVRNGNDQALQRAIGACGVNWRNASTPNYRMVLYCAEQQIEAKGRRDAARTEAEQEEVEADLTRRLQAEYERQAKETREFNDAATEAPLAERRPSIHQEARGSVGQDRSGITTQEPQQRRLEMRTRRAEAEARHQQALIEAVAAQFEQEERQAKRPRPYEYSAGIWTCPRGYVLRGGKCYGDDEPSPKFEMGR